MFFDAHELKNVAQLIELTGFQSAFCCGIIVSKHLSHNLLEFFMRKSRFQLAVIVSDVFEKVKGKEPIFQHSMLQVCFTPPVQHLPALWYDNAQ